MIKLKKGPRKLMKITVVFNRYISFNISNLGHSNYGDVVFVEIGSSWAEKWKKVLFDNFWHFTCYSFSFSISLLMSISKLIKGSKLFLTFWKLTFILHNFFLIIQQLSHNFKIAI